MSTRGPSIAPKSEPSPIALAGSPPSSGPSPRPITSLSVASPSGDLGMTTIMTSKEWVLPPRPKPGRKPSVDTPASKRKAQNRAAQRAFRERRATRVQELEQKLMEMEKEKEVKEMALVNTINKLKVENQFLIKSIEQLRTDMSSIRNSQTQTTLKMSQMAQPASSSKSSLGIGESSISNSPINHNTGSPASSAYSVQQISPAPSTDSPPSYANSHNYHNHNHNHQHQHHNSVKGSSNLTPRTSSDTTPDHGKSSQQNRDSSSFDCGVCLEDECLCESVGLKDPAPKKAEDLARELEETVNSFKPVPAVSLSRNKRKVVDTEAQEIDFTEQFSTKTKLMPDLKKLKKASSTSMKTSSQLGDSAEFNEDSPMENCGFCSFDTPCVCREAAKEAALLSDTLNQQTIEEGDEVDDEMSNEHKTLPPLQMNSNKMFRKSSLPVMHPGPSVEFREITNITPGVVPTVVTSTSRRLNPESSTSTSSSLSTLNSGNDASKDNSECTGNPGTCRQCQMDPMSTLFCTTVANKEKNEPGSRSRSSSTASPQPQMISRSGSRTSLPSMAAPITNPSTPVSTGSGVPASGPATPGGPGSTNNGMFIPCADAYKTLSRHKKFNSVDFSTLVGKLTTRGMQVEVQSVANVLRELDRRLYN
ncbi:hypothetical protein G9P44_005341 [Scheffersomyces stipitis]|nr:hypothetical protein G9P44_005341 [Scheffersomyces stipitis]